MSKTKESFVTRLGSFTRRWPNVYYFGSRVYSLLGSPIGMRVREKWWANRSIAKGYWNNRNIPSKHFLVEKIAAFSPVDSILEVGCSSGPNLYLLAQRFPDAQITGIDINREAVEYGNMQFAHEVIPNVKLLVGKADNLGEFQDRTIDIVFSNAVLVHIGPNKIKQVIGEMLRVTRRVLVLMEPHCSELNKKDVLESGLVAYHDGAWIRDYIALLKQFVPEKQIQITKIPEGIWPDKPWGQVGTVLTVARD